MRRVICLAVLTAFVLCNAGCIMAIGNRGTVKAETTHRQAVPLNGEIYLVDVADGSISRIDPVTVSQAEMFEYTETEIVEDE